ncbi:MAG: cell division protein FtsZ [bacterium]
MLIKPEIQKFAKIKVIGVGGAGGNAIHHMIESQKIQGVDFVSVNTDLQALTRNAAPTKLQIGRQLTNGLGSGANPSVGKAAAEESTEDIKNMLQGSDMVFITAGMGKGTGSGASPIVAELARSIDALTVAVVTKPFSFEGPHRSRNAEEAIEGLRGKVDALIVIPNQKLLQLSDTKLPLGEAFSMSDSVLASGVQGISDLIVLPGLVNVDFADVRTIMTNAGSALMGIGTASGENRASTAAKMAISSPLLEVSVAGAKGILFNIIGGNDITMHEVDEAARIISGAADPDANIIFGATIDEGMSGQLKITVVATGFDAETQQFEAERYTPAEELAAAPAEEASKDYSDTSVNEDPLDIPAFLRRK